MSRRGSVLIESILLVTLLVGCLFATEVEMIRFCNKRLEALQGERLRYDGSVRW